MRGTGFVSRQKMRLTESCSKLKSIWALRTLTDSVRRLIWLGLRLGLWLRFWLRVRLHLWLCPCLSPATDELITRMACFVKHFLRSLNTIHGQSLEAFLLHTVWHETRI